MNALTLKQNLSNTIDQITGDPLLIGFNRIFDDVFGTLQNINRSTYPLYNMIKHDENSYEIQMAVAGFERDELDVSINGSHLIVKGNKNVDDSGVNYIYKSIAHRSFTREWTLSETVVVENVSLKDGMLIIKLKNIIPEQKQPKSIPIL